MLFGMQTVTVEHVRDSVSESESVNEVPLPKILPECYDMRSEGRLNVVRSQGNQGTCWAFAALGALESSLLPDEKFTFSVDHMNHANGFNRYAQDGGDFNMALAYLASWQGPVNEADDPYGDGISGENLQPVVHVQEAVQIGKKDYEQIKTMILNYGGVQSSFYSDMENADSDSAYYNAEHFSYYYPGINEANHDVVIVGWDDHYPKEKFNVHPDNDGAFICRNSWGTEFGEDGYFYISYEDVNIGINNLVYTRVESTDNYDSIYQSDLLGWIGAIGYNQDTAWVANVYTAQGDEHLKAVSFYTTDRDSIYDIYVIKDFTDTSSFGSMQYVCSGDISEAGYYTINIPKDIYVNKGQSFAAVIRLTTKGTLRPIVIEYNSGELTKDVVLEDGQGYISNDGQLWESLEDVYECNACLKVFTEKIEDRLEIK